MSQLESANFEQPGQMAPGFGADPAMGNPAMGAGPGMEPGPGAPVGPGMPASPAVEKQRLSVYTMMLVLSFIAIVTGITLLHLEIEQIKKDPPGKPYDTIQQTWKATETL